MNRLGWFLALTISLSIAGCGEVEETAMPAIMGMSLDLALSDTERGGFTDEMEVLGRGLLVVIDKSNWEVCEQEPAAGAAVTETPRLIVDCACAGSSPEQSSPTSNGSSERTSAASALQDTPASSSTAAPIPAEVPPLTVASDEALAALQALTDSCSAGIAASLKQRKAGPPSSTGGIGAMNNHGDYQTGYDILLIFGDDGLNAKGPAFQFRDVNTVSDLNTAGADIPDTIGVGDDLLITARIDQHEEQTCLLLLEPIETEIRQLPQLHLRLTGEGYRGSTPEPLSADVE